MICSSAPSCYVIIVAIEVDINPLRNGAWCNTMNKWCEWKIKCYCWKVSFCWKMKRTTTTKKKMVKIECNKKVNNIYSCCTFTNVFRFIYMQSHTPHKKDIYVDVMWRWYALMLCNWLSSGCCARTHNNENCNSSSVTKTKWNQQHQPKMECVCAFFLHCFWRY